MNETFSSHLIQDEFLCCDVIRMGEDYTLAVYGGDKPHVGSVVISVARPSLTGKGLSTTSSVFNCMGHKDEKIARMFAESLAVQQNCTVVCSCGIHFDKLSREGIAMVREKCVSLLEKVLDWAEKTFEKI